MACWPSLATRTWYPAAASSISSSRGMNGSSSTTNSFSPLPSAPGSTSLTVPLSPLEAPWTRPAPRTHRPSRPAPTQAHAQVIGRDRSAAYRPSSTCPRKVGLFLSLRGTMHEHAAMREGHGDAGVGNLPGRDGRHAAGPPPYGDTWPRADDPRQARDAEPGRFGQGPDRHPDDRGRRAAWAARP